MTWFREKRITELQQEVSQLLITGTHQRTRVYSKHRNQSLPRELVHGPQRAEVAGHIALRVINAVLFQPTARVRAQRTIRHDV